MSFAEVQRQSRQLDEILGLGPCRPVPTGAYWSKRKDRNVIEGQCTRVTQTPFTVMIR